MANQQLTINNWHKSYIYAGCALTMWLASHAPVGKVGKGVFISLSLLHSVALVRIAKPLIEEEAKTIAQNAMKKELRNTELVLQEKQEEDELAKLYAPSPSSSDGSNPEIINELRESLEALWLTVAEESKEEISSSEDRKNLYRAVVNLLEAGRTETFVIKEVLGFQGRNYQTGKGILEGLLKEGAENEW
jgi:hypothetical protein